MREARNYFFFFEAIFLYFTHSLSDDEVTIALEFNLNKLNMPHISPKISFIIC